jgi:predicted DNA-binding transcriptional regulator YafY
MSAPLLRLLSLLHARRDWSGASFAERLEVSERTVRRDCMLATCRGARQTRRRLKPAVTLYTPRF